MSTQYLPEGRLLHTRENRAACGTLPGLLRAADREQVLEGRVTACTPDHDLLVSLGPFTGRIPREEGALGIREGTARDLSLLTRVGKAAAFTVTGVREGALLLSRRRAQELALEGLFSLAEGTVIPATVTHLEPFGAFVDVGCGVISLLGIQRISVARLAHGNQRFTPGQEIHVLLTGKERSLGRVTLSHKELLGTWAENAARFRPGMTVPGHVRSIRSYGSFIELAPNLSGLADQTEGLAEGDRVSVYIRSIRPEGMKVKLTVIQRLEPLDRPEPLHYFITEGQPGPWVYPPPEDRRRAR